ncbi:hypothetical protein [Komagataeibacter medellinensis]|uniref:hypothetical protein n=1 Tax=Komagataeibacter medellinensis TaxID=1177712 RepID=UPI0011D1B5B0|nr:hypothetical protein [Komagataeibacter medellinensis]
MKESNIENGTRNLIGDDWSSLDLEEINDVSSYYPGCRAWFDGRNQTIVIHDRNTRHVVNLLSKEIDDKPATF